MDEAIHASRTAMAVPGLHRGWMMALGVLMVVLGLIGLGMTYSLTGVVVRWSGILAIVAGAGHLLDAFDYKAPRGVAWHVFVGAIYILLGIMLVTMPMFSAFWLTKLIALALVLTGVTRFVIMFLLRGQRGLQALLLISAIISVGLGIYIFQLLAPPQPEIFATPEAQAAWVRSWNWVIGLFVAIELITEGIALMAISRHAKTARGS